MKVWEALNLVNPILLSLKSLDLKANDAKYLEMYKDFRRLKLEGHKVEYIVTYISGIYKISRPSIFSIVSKFEKEITESI